MSSFFCKSFLPIPITKNIELTQLLVHAHVFLTKSHYLTCSNKVDMSMNKMGIKTMRPKMERCTQLNTLLSFNPLPLSLSHTHTHTHTFFHTFFRKEKILKYKKRSMSYFAFSRIAQDLSNQGAL